ncbi:MAG: hypothetical protein Aureis2KO_17270 [Aureisphaera sp.]
MEINTRINSNEVSYRKEGLMMPIDSVILALSQNSRQGKDSASSPSSPSKVKEVLNRNSETKSYLEKAEQLGKEVKKALVGMLEVQIIAEQNGEGSAANLDYLQIIEKEKEYLNLAGVVQKLSKEMLGVKSPEKLFGFRKEIGGIINKGKTLLMSIQAISKTVIASENARNVVASIKDDSIHREILQSIQKMSDESEKEGNVELFNKTQEVLSKWKMN